MRRLAKRTKRDFKNLKRDGSELIKKLALAVGDQAKRTGRRVEQCQKACKNDWCKAKCGILGGEEEEMDLA